MAELGGFEDDPAADFLAREKDDLGGLVDDTLGGGIDTTGVRYRVIHIARNFSCHIFFVFRVT